MTSAELQLKGLRVAKGASSEFALRADAQWDLEQLVSTVDGMLTVQRDVDQVKG